MGGEVTLKLPFILGHIDDSLEDNRDHDDAIVEKKLVNKNDKDDDDEEEVCSKPKVNVEQSTSIGDVNSCKKNCRNDDESGANGVKRIEKCRNENGLSIDVIVEDMSDRKNEPKNVLECSTRTRSDGNETERNINVVTAQIHSSAI